MKFDAPNKRTVISSIITICLILLIVLLVKCCESEYHQKIQEGLQNYGDETKSLAAPLPYKTTMEDIKYPNTSLESGEAPIYDIGNEKYNHLLFNKGDKSMHFSDDRIMKDIKYFNNASNLLLEHYLNNNIPDSTSTYFQDKLGTEEYFLDETEISANNYYESIKFSSEVTDKKENVPNLFNYDDRTILKEKVYLYRLSDDYDKNGNDPPTNGMYVFKDTATVNYGNSGKLETDNIYNYNYDLSGMKHEDVYDELTKYNTSSFNDVVSMIEPGKYSSHFFESKYQNLSDDITKDFKYFYSTAPTIAYHGLFNKV